MPFIPSGLPGFTIRPPCTLHDATGEPSNDLYADVKRVFDFIDDERHLTAHRLWCSVQQRLQEAEHRYQQQQQKQQLSASSSLNRKIGVGIGSIFSHSQNLHRKKKERRGASVHFENLYHDIQKIKELLERKKNLIDKLEVRTLLLFFFPFRTLFFVMAKSWNSHNSSLLFCFVLFCFCFSVVVPYVYIYIYIYIYIRIVVGYFYERNATSRKRKIGRSHRRFLE
jgi:hypothetical protein